MPEGDTLAAEETGAMGEGRAVVSWRLSPKDSSESAGTLTTQ